jgi:outer membrane protein TolC
MSGSRPIRRRFSRAAALLAGVSISLWLRAAAAQETLGLEKAINSALRQNRRLRVAELALSSAEVAADEARGAFAPVVTPKGDVRSYSEGDVATYGFGAALKTTWGTEWSGETEWSRQDFGGSADTRRGAVRVEVSQPMLRRLGPLVNREPVVQAESRVAAARRELEMEKTDLVVEVAGLFEETLLLQQQVRYEEQAQARLRNLVRLTEARLKQGRATRVDLLRVEQQAGESVVRLSQSHERLAAVRADLADAMGMPPDSRFVVEPAAPPDLKIPPADAAARIALSNRLDFAQAEQDLADARRGVRIARRNRLPDLSLLSRAERFGTGGSYSDAGALDEDAWFVGLAAETDFPRREERLAERQAGISASVAEENLEMLKSGIQRQVMQATLAYERARSDVQSAERNFRVAERRATLARRLYEIGRGDNFGVSDAEDALLQARNQMLGTQSQVSVAAYRLLRALGTLLEYPEELKPSPPGDGQRSQRGLPTSTAGC